MGIDFSISSPETAAAAVRSWLQGEGYFNLAFANPEFLLTAQKDPELTAYLRQCRAVFADGAGIAWASKLHGGQIRGRITGTDFQWKVFEIAAELGLSIFIYGGRPGVAAIGLDRIRERLPRLQRLGCCHGYLPPDEAMRQIADFRPAVLMVCLGNPQQEHWIARNGRLTGARLVFGNGGAVDFIAGQVRRAPRWMREHSLEWLWRLGQDPSWARVRRQARLARYVAKVLGSQLRSR